MATNHAEPCRALVAARDVNRDLVDVLARDPLEGSFPCRSLVAFASDARGRFLLARLAEHTENLRAARGVARAGAPGLAPDLALGRVTLLGRCTPVPDAEKSACGPSPREAAERRDPIVDFADFALPVEEPQALRYVVAGSVACRWVDVKDYLR